MFVASASLAGQEHDQIPGDENEEQEHTLHPNHFGGLLAVSGRSDIDELAPTIGLEYARVFARHWAVVTYVELVSSQLERDIILAAGVAYYPRIIPVSLGLALGIEGYDEEVVHGGMTETESGVALLVRMSLAYAISLTPTAALAPTIMIDQAQSRTTVVIGLGMAVGF